MKQVQLLQLLLWTIASLSCACDDSDSSTSYDPGDAAGGDASVASADAAQDALSVGGDANADALDALPSVQPPSLIVLTHEFGFLDESFRLPDVADGAEVSFSAVGELGSPILSPFSKLRQHLVAVAGAGYHVSWDQDVNQPTMLLTGQPNWRPPTARPGDPPQALGPSVDWLVGRYLRQDSPVAHQVTVMGTRSFTFDETGKNVPAARSLGDVAKELNAQANCEVEIKPQTQSADGLASWMDQLSTVLLQALRCDGPRVFTGSLPRPSQTELPFRSDLAQDAAHRIGVPGDDGRAARAVMQTYNVLVATQVARLGESLLMQRGRDGRPLLDSTLIVWVGREGQPDHDPFPWHAILLGGRNLGLATGRYISLAQTTDFPAGTDVIKTGPPHNKLLTSIARLFGLKIDNFGAKSLSLKNGATLDLTGYLPQLELQ